jgi:hypothetical protein
LELSLSNPDYIYGFTPINFIFVHFKYHHMKIIRLTFLAALIVGLIGFSSCGPDNNAQPTVEQTQLGKLNISKGWVVTKAELDGVDYLADYAGFKIVVTGTFSADGATYDYTLTNRPIATAAKPGLKSPWPDDAGKWKFGSPPSSVIIRDPDVPANLQEIGYTVTTDKLQLDFNYVGAGYSSKVSGNWHMEFAPAP